MKTTLRYLVLTVGAVVVLVMHFLPIGKKHAAGASAH